ncbi:iron ABC transporter permease [Afifella sp. IM 167]|uniref:ABC transporter permease n=1 Tax=Afifella sp. IM 167 TaxID=2033586 RepID=UPI001CCB2D35|nr:iron ABC transporter permease [Afifella sp. IM 167]MBZ8131954.1 hypothetical protein [Afifella sp. IM 167]
MVKDRGAGTMRNPLFGRTAGQLAVLALVAALVLPPISALFVGALSRGRPSLDFEFSLLNIQRALSNSYIVGSLVNSLIFATLAATIVVAMGTAIAWVVERTDSRFRKWAQVFSLIPIIIPAVTLVSAWIMLLGPRGGLINLIWQEVTGSSEPLFNVFSFAGMIWIATLQELPLAVLWLLPVFRAMNPELEEAGRTAGASSARVLFRITLPLLRPALAGAWMIFFIYSLGALSVAILIGMPARIFLYSTEIYLATTRMPAQYGLASLYSLLFLVVTIVCIAVYYRLIGDTGRFATVGGKSFRPRIMPLGRWRLAVDGALLFLVLMIAGLPIMILLWNAVMPFPQIPSWEALDRFTTKNFGAALAYGPAMRAVWNSLWIGTIAGIGTSLLGTAIAWMRLRQTDSYGLVSITEQAAMAPMAVPGLIVGVSLLWFFLAVPVGIYATPWILVIAYVILHLPYAVRITSSGLMQLHVELEEAGRVSGAGTGQLLRLIVLPLVGPTILSAIVYTSLRAFREYSASIFLISPGNEVFSVVVLDMWQGGNSNLLAAYTVMVMALLVILLVAANIVTKRLGVRSEA